MSNWFKSSQIEERHNDFGSSVVLGNQWGDEGKGKISDILMQHSDVVIRFNGGHNAGHTVKVGDKEFDLHILPSGMVTEGKTNIITSGCVLGIHLNKIDISQIKVTPQGVYCNSTLGELLKRQEGELVEVGMIPELEKLQQGGIDISKSGLKISGETKVIGMHNVLLDAYDEQCRDAAGLKKIGSTGSGISRAYSSETQRYHFTLNDLLYHQDLFEDSIKALWEGYKHAFPNIKLDDLIQSAREEREKIKKYILNGDIEIIENETQYIKSLHKNGNRIVGEGAQSSMIGSGNSFFGTASDPSLQNFMNTTGLTAKKVGNLMLIHKIPSSSVGERPDYLQFTDSQELDEFRRKYKEHGVSTGRLRDLFHHSLTEIARGAWLNARGIDTESKIVSVYNRVDGIEDSLKLDNGILRIVTGFEYKAQKIIDGPKEIIQVGVHGNELLNPKNLLNNYPEKSAQAKLFDVTHNDLIFKEIKGDINQQIDQLLAYCNAAIFKNDDEKEFLIGTGPSRDDIELRRGMPLRA